VVTLQFTVSAVSVRANRLTGFSAAGPNVDAGIKPDLAAVGADIYVATQTLDPAGDMYDSSGYILVDGTSFSTPLVAGAAALIKSARPGLTVDQYRSLLINTAAAVQTRSGQTPSIQQAGAGLLDVSAALRSTATAYPASLSFGAGGLDADISRVLTLTNVGQGTESFAIAAAPRMEGPAPAAGAATVELAPGATVEVPVSWSVRGIATGTYDGFLTVTALSSGARINIPYWYAATSGTPAHITVLDSVTSGRRGSIQRDAILFRVTDVSGVALAGVQPQVTAVSGGGAASRVTSYDGEAPGLFGADVRLGPSAGTNLFRIRVGTVTLDVSITGS
jgi:minor extracellular serine protease Vpr